MVAYDRFDCIFYFIIIVIIFIILNMNVTCGHVNCGLLGGVYMRKLAPARVSYRHDFLISYRVYMMTGLFHISLFEGTLHVDKMHV